VTERAGWAGKPPSPPPARPKGRGLRPHARPRALGTQLIGDSVPDAALSVYLQQQHMPHAGPAVCACARVCARVRVWVWWRVLYAQFQYQGIWGFPSAASMSGSLLLVDVWAACLDRVRRVDMCVVRWTEAALSEPYWQSVQ
jgi:hypothetical protein